MFVSFYFEKSVTFKLVLSVSSFQIVFFNFNENLHFLKRKKKKFLISYFRNLEFIMKSKKVFQIRFSPLRRFPLKPNSHHREGIWLRRLCVCSSVGKWVSPPPTRKVGGRRERETVEEKRSQEYELFPFLIQEKSKHGIESVRGRYGGRESACER